jgi:SPP1 family predicted phage head-tail adaptor
MQSGRMDRLVVLQAVTETRSASGAVTQAWATLATVWAQLVSSRGSERLEAAGEQARQTRIWRIRHRTDITNKHRLTYDGTVHEILSITEIGRREGLELQTVARAD